MWEKIGRWASILGAIPTIYIIGSKVGEVVGMIDKTVFLEIAIVAITLSGLGIYLVEKYKELRRKRVEKEETHNKTHDQHDDRLKKVEEFINKYVYNADVLMREVKKIDIERQQILNDVNNFYNGLTARIEKLEYKSSSERKVLGGSALTEEAIRQVTGNIKELGDKK